MTDMVTVNARFANGVLTPLEPIDLPEGALVALHIETSVAAATGCAQDPRQDRSQPQRFRSRHRPDETQSAERRIDG